MEERKFKNFMLNYILAIKNMIGFNVITQAWQEFQAWRVLYKLTAKEEVIEQLASYGFKVSWFGIPYKLIVIPNEFLETDATVNNYMFGQLREIDQTIAMPLNIREIVHPAFVDVSPGVYLVKLEPERTMLRFKKLVPVLLGWSLFSFIAYRLAIKFELTQHVVRAISSLYCLLF